MSELLIELFSEEIPANLQESSVKTFELMMLNNFKEEGLNYNKSEVYWSPMRLTLCVEGMDSKSKDISINKRGPRFDANDSAINGFARGLEVNKNDLVVEETEKGKFYFYKNLKKGTSAEIIIENSIKDIVVSFPWKKSMRWGSNNLKWIRPLHNILCIFDGKPIKFNIDSLKSNSLTNGHRYLAANSINISNKEDYINQLLKANVIINPTRTKRSYYQIRKKTYQ